MRIATFNLRGGGSRRHWIELLQASEANLLLIQESKDPAGFPSSLFDSIDLSPAHWGAVGHGRWGSALLTRGASVQRIPVPDFAGWVVGGVLVFGDTEFHLFSVHLPPLNGSYVRSANRLIDVLKPIVGGAPVILGGDWNLTVGRRCSTEEKRNTRGELELLDRLDRELGVIPAWSTFHPGEPLPQTLRWSNDPLPPYHCDGVFLPRAWAAGIRSVEVLTGEPWIQLSDHNPVVVECDEAGAPARWNPGRST